MSGWCPSVLARARLRTHPQYDPPTPPAGGTRDTAPKRTPTPTEARRMAHDRAMAGEKPWRTKCRALGHEPPCSTPTDCKLLEARRDD